MKIIKNKLSNIGKAKCDCENLDSLPFIPHEPLPAKNFAIAFIGVPKSGKSNLLQQLLTSKKTKKSNLYYRGLFDRIEFISPSSATLPKSFKELLPEERIHSEYSDILVQDLIDDMYCGPNVNQLIVFDDCIKDINNSRTLSRVFQNRRHCTQKCDDPDDDETASLSIMISSQKFTMIPLEFRNSISDFIIFKASAKPEINRIIEELMFDLDQKDALHLLNLAWSQPYSFIYIKPLEQLENKYYIRFDKVVFD